MGMVLRLSTAFCAPTKDETMGAWDYIFILMAFFCILFCILAWKYAWEAELEERRKERENR